jgi:hypothetical protein
MTAQRDLSFSQIASFLTCRHRWAIEYGLRIRPRGITFEALALGDAVHNGIAAALRGEDSFEALDRWQKKALAASPLDDPAMAIVAQDIRNLAEPIVVRLYADLIKRGYFIVNDENGPIVEREFRIPVEPSHIWSGFKLFLDCLLAERTETGDVRLWICDFKVRGTFANEANVDYDLQMIAYQHVLNELGIETAGTITYQIANKPPALPKENKPAKDGTRSFSRARIATDWNTYRSTLVAAGVDPQEYEAEMIPKLDYEFVRPLKAFRSKEQVARVWREVVEPLAKDIADTHRSMDVSDQFDIRNSVPRNLSSFTCGNCKVKSLCLAGLKDYDIAGLANQYESKFSDGLFRYAQINGQ